MQCTEDYTIDKELFNDKKINDGFFSNFHSISLSVFGLVPPILAWVISKDFKVLIITLLSCLFLTVLCTVRKNTKHNKKLLEKARNDLIESAKNISNLKSSLAEKENELSTIKKDFQFLKDNRDALIKMVDSYKEESEKYKLAYKSAKLGVKGIIRVNRMTKDKEAILKLFEEIETGNRKDVSNEE